MVNAIFPLLLLPLCMGFDVSWDDSRDATVTGPTVLLQAEAVPALRLPSGHCRPPARPLSCRVTLLGRRTLPHLLSGLEKVVSG